MNRASNEMENGGQITSKVKAVVPKNQKVRGWKFNETELYPNATVTHFVVRTLNTSMTYQPILGKVKASSSSMPPVKFPRPVLPAPPIAPLKADSYTVICKGCTFSGGGYTNATNGKVPSGTKITVRTDYGGGVSSWTVNGNMLYSRVKGFSIGPFTKDSFTRTVKNNLTIVCYMKIN